MASAEILQETSEVKKRPILTEMDIKVLQGLADGLNNYQIGQKLSSSRLYSAAYIKGVREKLYQKTRDYLDIERNDGEAIINALISACVRMGLVENSHGLELTDNLKPYEERIADLICEGKRTANIAADIGISWNTARRYKISLYEKLAVYSPFSVVAKWTALKMAHQSRKTA
jgi:DNA-binding NarL/FixJ family response regulator